MDLIEILQRLVVIGREESFEDLALLTDFQGGCKNFCVNGHLAGNCRATRSDDDRSKESRTEGVAGQSAG
jgi:hypothetical protein